MSEYEYADGWRPEEGDVLVGRVIGLDIGWSKFPAPRGSNYPIITVHAEEGSTQNGEDIAGDDVAVHCFHAALKSKMSTLKPVLGETIGMQYQGKRKSKQNAEQEVAVYAVRVKGRTADVWGALAPPPEQQMPTHGGFTPHPTSDVPADTSDFTSGGTATDTDNIPF